MRIVACMKAVRSELIEAGQKDDEMLTLNPYDYYALQDVLRAKKQCFDNPDACCVTCLSMGTSATKDVLTKCIAFGADQAVLLSDQRFGGADTVATTYTLTKAVQKMEMPSLIVCGQKSVDGETGQVVYGLAKRLNIACIVGVTAIVEVTDTYVVLNILDEESEKTIKVDFPAVVVYQKFTTKYKSVSLLKLKQAKRKEIIVYNLDDIHAAVDKCGSLGSKTKVVKIDFNFMRKAEKHIVGKSLAEKTEAILNVIDRCRMEGL